MFDKITRILMTISNYMDHTEELTKKLIGEVSEESINQFMNGVDNRDRLIKIIGKFNGTLEQTLNKLPSEERKVLDTVLLNHWYQDLTNWKNRMSILDEAMMVAVQEIKDQTQRDIRSTFDTKNKVVGYNLRSTK